MGLTNVKYISDKIGQKFIDYRPYHSFEQLHAKVMEKGSGLNSRALQALSLVGAATFPDHPKVGNERDFYYEYLSLPAFNTDLPISIKEQFRPLDEYSENESFISLAMVRGIQTGQGWARAEIVDESGSAGVFTNQNTNLEVGQMYAMLISNNRISRYVSVNDLVNDKGGDFQDFIEAKSFPDVPEGMLRVVSFNARVTKAGKKMANVVLCDEFKNLTDALVFPSQFMKCFARMGEGKVVDVKFGRTKEGTLFVDNVL